MKRLFVALDLPNDVLTQLQGIAGGIPGAKWISPDRIHLTLSFIGEVSHTMLEEINFELSQIRANVFSIQLEGVDIFANRKQAHTLWARVSKSSELMSLQARIEAGLVRTKLKPTRRKYVPHVTLARLRSTSHCALEAFLIRNSSLHTPMISVRSFVLYSSHLSRSGSFHQIEAEYSLY